MPRPSLLALVVGLAGCLPLEFDGRASLPDEPPPVTRGTVSDAALAEAVDVEVLRALETGAVGLAVAIVRGDEVVYDAAYGWADLADGRALTPDTPILLSSVTKTFAGVSALQAVEDGVLSLDDPIADLVGFEVANPRRPDDPVTVGHLLHHTSGVRDRRAWVRSYTVGDPDVPLDDFLRDYLLPEGDLYRRAHWAADAPGEVFDYSNVGMALAAHGVAGARGVSYDALVRDRILGPLRMVHSAWYLSGLAAMDQPAPAVPYGPGLQVFPQYGYPTYPDGLLRSTAHDMGRYLAMVLGEGTLEGATILTPASVDRMLTVDGSIGTDEAGQAVAWAQVDYAPGRTLFGHSGGDYGSIALVAVDREAGVGVVALGNSNAGDFEVLFDVYASLFDLAEAGPGASR